MREREASNVGETLRRTFTARSRDGWAILYGDSPIHVSKGGLRACYSASCCLSLAGYTNILLVMACVFGYSPLEPQRKPQYRLVQLRDRALSKAKAPTWPSQAFGLRITLCMTLYFRWEKARRDKREGVGPVKGMGAQRSGDCLRSGG
ncbi:hypothetical protein NBRC10512_005121 [Rhodotorula toruloides]|uniref:RHTO0S02e14752g1_1 n=2 Tax=Rhodotorula toruloides TaxID=5286 RepID=A0A061AIP5_RHOTO|nr:uncharacterized protein RHTO_07128 [Rhodotorula toruloides NP11]EMS23394.1 hypothetical protein RHTO_07128 [Rhodotorula toruloides NP11]CDR37424.1 RHTO0S02e14752g1_1 [Rhodotorula toruloides]